MNFNPLADPCLSCGLWQGKKKPCIRPKIFHKTDVLLVGEAPGANEDNLGEAFVGRSGAILREILARVGTSLWEVLNAVRCRPTTPDGRNRAPSAKEIEFCSPFLQEELAAFDPTLVIALGRTAARALGLPDLSLRDLRHRLWTSPFGADVWVTWHPAAGLRPGKDFVFKELEEDLASAFSHVGCLKSGIDKTPKVGYTEDVRVEEEDRIVVDIETSGFFKDGDAFPFDGKGEILLVGVKPECHY